MVPQVTNGQFQLDIVNMKCSRKRWKEEEERDLHVLGVKRW